MDSNWIEIFEKYLNDNLSDQDRIEFEAKLSSDKELEESFLIYKSIEQEFGNSIRNKSKENELRGTLQSLSKEYSENTMISTSEKPKALIRIISLVSSIAASLILIFFVYNKYFGSEMDMQQIALSYFNSDLERIGQTMGSNKDSLQMGISFYNQKEYFKAVQVFENMIVSDPSNSEVIKNLGLSYLGLEEYDNALAQFEKLSQMEQLYSNPGQFYKALALLLRNESGDKNQAKELLQKVIDEDQEGSKNAKEWLEKF
ncbi:Tetratricopeptide repeat-containing protein [Aquiflexum balticum DSM 16537]|uniref:Tetratricopeptide repeat-containing protein n=1 Tax=Aquiflexum balticum DSM 16537 TaxID=758820 RepID=A0A1W2H5C5_9BACT|nr:tetratricopeptide repeat protein [Aquiflexum balticum]SMD44113.1 Tetratricopeptide repeat-containing protein [Aquiflexum balticum DSM 16537]